MRWGSTAIAAAIACAAICARVDAASIRGWVGGGAATWLVVQLIAARLTAPWLDRAREQERTRIARELHDVLGHHLAALSIQLDLARRRSDEGARAPLDAAYAVAQRMLVEVRGTVSALRSNEYDLRTALDAVVEAVPEPAISVSYGRGVAVKDPDCAHAALRCIQEAITNTVKHARATHIDVGVSRRGRHLVLVVRDDGEAAGRIHAGNGLKGMRERIEHLGGALEVHSLAGRGTTVRARLPMRPS